MKYAVLLLVVGTALGVPILPDADDVQCNSLFQYKKQYSFSYTGITQTGIIGTEDVTSDARITCTQALIRVPQKCTVILTLGSCSIIPATEQTRAFASSLERYELMARVTNGLITEVLPHVDESVEALNLKRGVLSAAQMEFHGQVDEELHSRQLSIHGNCSTKTIHVGSESQDKENYVVKRDLSSCTQRPTTTPMLWRGLGYLQNLDLGQYLINSSQVCHYQTDDKKGRFMHHAQCKEVHSFWPGSISNDRGIMTTITQEMGPVEVDKMNSLDFKADRYDKRSTNIIQELPEVESIERLTTDEAMEFIKPLVGNTLEEVKVESPRLFGNWVKALRSLDNATIHEVFEKVYNCKEHSEKCRTIPGKAELAREYLWDGLVQCGTLECFSVMNTAIIKNIVPKPLAHVMLYTMAFRDYPTIDIISEGVRLAHFNRSRSVLLPISTIIYRYWLNNPEVHSQRELPAPINEFVELMNNIINTDCSITAAKGTPEAVEQEHQVLLAVKAIGNLGPVAQKFDETDFKKKAHFERELLKCASNSEVSFNVSLSAIQALRRFNMSIVSNVAIEAIKTALLEPTRDVEQRIALYLIYMESTPPVADLRDLYTALKTEPSKQFKAFTLSHIGNILESEDPTVQDLRKNLALAIGEEDLPEYPMNIFKYSRNIELSKLISILNKTFGGTVEGNIIYNPNAVMPKSVMIKTAVNALGSNWELVESGLEVQGFEVIMESIFGPAGLFPSNMMRTLFRKADEVIASRIRSTSISLEWLADIMEIIMNPEQYEDITTKASKKLYSLWNNTDAEPTAEPEPEPTPENLLPSDIEENLAEIHEQVNKENKEKIAAVYLRILGNELGYITLDDLKGLIPVFDRQTIVDMFADVTDKLAEGVNVNTTRSLLFLERKLVLPTGIGMPLNCSTNGTVMFSVRTRGQISLNLPKASISGRLAPSAALELVGTMGVHIPTTKIYTAVMANASVYHNSEFEGNVSLDGPAVKVQLKPIKRSLNIIKFALDYFLLKPDGEIMFIPGIMQDAVNYEKCLNTGEILGASLCLSFTYPNASMVEIAPRFPLTGPVRFAVTMENADESLEAYTFEAKYKQIVKAGAAKATKKPTKKSFGKVGKKDSFVNPEEVIDAIVISFSAPGDELTRNISTMVTFNRNKTEAKWSFEVPELEGLKVFAGALNLSDETGASGVHFVWNATYMDKNASVSLTLKNSSVVDQSNYTAVFNASVQQLYFATVGQFLNTENFMIVSFNETYYWDDETPLYDQLTFPVSDYAIKPWKYHTCENYFSSFTKKRVTNSKFFTSHLGQNLTIESEAFTTRDSYVNEIKSKFENQFMNVDLANFTYTFDDETRNRIRTSRRYLDVHRGDHALYYQEDGVRDVRTNTMSRNYTWGIKSLQKIKRSSFADISDSVLLAKFEESEIYDFVPVNLNTTLHFAYVNESEPSHCSHFTSLNLTVSVPRSTDLRDQTRWGFGSTLRFINESATEERHQGYVLQLNQTIPILLLDFSNEIAIRNTTKGLNVSFSHQTMERKYGKHVNVDLFNNIDVENAAMQNGINFTSPYYNYSGSFMMVLNELEGLVVKNAISQEGGVIPDITDFLHDYYLTVKLWQNASVGFQITNKVFNISTNHMINLDGPVTDFEVKQVPFWVRDFINKTLHLDLEGMETSLREVSYKITNSSIMVGNDLVVRMPYIFNVSMDHDLFFNMDRVNHTLAFLVKRPGVNFNIDYALVGPDEATNFYNISSEVTGNVGTFTKLRSMVNGKAKYGKSLNSNFVMVTTVTTPQLVNSTLSFVHTIKGLKEITRFDTVEWNIAQETESILGNSNMGFAVKLDTFKKLFKFTKSEAMLTVNVMSRFLQAALSSGITGSEFNEFAVFGKTNTTTALDVLSPLVNFTLESVSEVNNVGKDSVIGSVVSKNTYSFESVLGNVGSTFGWEVMDLQSPWDFQRSNGSSLFTVTSKLVNVTTAESMEFVGVDGLFTFEKVSGMMNWNAATILGDVTVGQMFELNNFENITRFESAVASANIEMTSKYLGSGDFVAKAGIYDKSALLVIREANATVEANIEIPWVTSSLSTVAKIVNVQGLFKSKRITVKTNYGLTSPLLNVTNIMSSVCKNMDGLFTFDSWVNSWTHRSSAPFTSGLIDITSEVSGSTGPFTHGLMLNNITLNWATPVGVVEVSYIHNRENAAGLFKFEMANIDARTAFISKLFNMTMEGSMVGNGFESLFKFQEFTTSAVAEAVVWKVLDLKAAHASATVNSTTITSFGKFTLVQNATVETPFTTLEVTQEADMLNLRSLLSYDRFATFTNVDMVSILVNSTNAFVIDITNRNGLFTFGSLRIGLSNNMTTPVSEKRNNIGFEILDMVELTQSSKIAAGITTSVVSKLLTIESASGLKILGQRSLFVFDNVGAGVNMTISSPVLNVTVALGSEMVNSRGMMQWASFKTGGSGSVDTPFVNMEAEAGMEILDRNGFSTFGKLTKLARASITSSLANLTMVSDTLVLNHQGLMVFDIYSRNASFSLVSDWLSMDQGYKIAMRRSGGLFKSEIVEFKYDGSSTGIVDSTSRMSFVMTGNNGLGVYTKLQVNQMMNLYTLILNSTSTNMFQVTNADGLLTFARGELTSGMVVDHPFGSIEWVGTVNMDDFRGPLNFTSLTMAGKINAGGLLTADAGADFINFEGPFVFDRWNASMMVQSINPFINFTQDSAVGVVGSRGFFNASNAYLTTGSTWVTAPGRQTSILSINIEDMTSLTNFTKINATVAWDVDTILMSSIHASTLLLNNVRDIFDFDGISMVSTTNVVSLPANATVNFMYLLNDVTGFMKFAEMTFMANTTAKSIVGDLDTAGTVTVSKMRGLLKLDVLKISATTDVTGPLCTFNLNGNLLARKVVNITSFKLINSDYSMNLVSMPMNATSIGSFRVEASNNIFDVALIEGSHVTNISIPLLRTNASSSMLIREMTSLNEFGEINVANQLRTITPLTDGIVNFVLGGTTSWADVEQRFDTSLSTEAGSIELAQLIDYENAKISLTLPGYAYVHLHGHLNQIGDELTIKMKHALEDQDLVEDLRLLLKLNQSDIIYSNFSWNPEVVAELMDISTDTLDRAVEYSLGLYRAAKDNLKEIVDQVNDTVHEIMEDPQAYFQQNFDLSKLEAIKEELKAIKEKIEDLKTKVEELIKVFLEDPKQAVKDFYEVIRVTVEAAKETIQEKYEELYQILDEHFLIQDKVDYLKGIIDDIVAYIENPEETWELIKTKLEELKTKLEEYLQQIKESVNYDLIKETILDIVDVRRIQNTWNYYIDKVSMENLIEILEDLKLLINLDKVQEVYDGVMDVQVNVGCVTFKDLRDLDLERINSAYDKIREFIMIENLKQFINIDKVEEITERINQTLRENLDYEVWRRTLRRYVDIPLLKATLEDLSEWGKTKVDEIIVYIEEKAELAVEELNDRYVALKEAVEEFIQLFKDALVEVSGMTWVELKEEVQMQLTELQLKLTELSEDLQEKLNLEKVEEVLLDLKEFVASEIDMTKIDEAIEQLKDTLNTIIDATKDESHPINRLPMEYFETTIYDFLVSSLEKITEASDEYGEIAFEWIKEYGQKLKEVYDTYKPEVEKLIEEYVEIVKEKIELIKEKSQELYEQAKEQYDIYSVKAQELADELIEYSVAEIETLGIELEERLLELNETLYDMYDEYSPLIYDFVFDVTEMSMDYARNVADWLIESSKPVVEKFYELMDTYDVLEHLISYKNDLLIQSEDVCINITLFVEKTIEKLPEYKEQLIALTEEYKLLADEFYRNVTIFKDEAIVYLEEQLVLLQEFMDTTWEQVIEIAKNEENLLNYYPTEWTGKTVYVLSEETIEYLKEKSDELRETAELKYEELKDLVDAKVEELKVYLNDPDNMINRLPVEFLEMTLLEIYDEVKENVIELVEQGYDYIDVAKIFIEETIVSVNETRLEYNITVERLQDLIIEFNDSATARLNEFMDWLEVAREQPYDVTKNQVIGYVEGTFWEVVDVANATFIRTVEISLDTLDDAIELWEDLTSEESLDRIPVYVDKALDVFADTIFMINKTVCETIRITKRIAEIVEEESGIPEKYEEIKEKLEEYWEIVDEYRIEAQQNLTEAWQAAEELFKLTKDFVFDRSIGYVEYLNNTLPGWMYRYYKMDAMPYELFNYTVVKGKETIIFMFNSTVDFIDDVSSRFVEFNLDDNSFTVNFTHPFYWTSFRKLPSLTDSQLDALAFTKDEIMARLILPSQYQIERLSELIKIRYAELMVYINGKIEENRPQVEAKLDELREKIEETRKQIEAMREQFSWDEFKENVTEAYNDAKDYLKENVPIFVEDLKVNVTNFVEELREDLIDFATVLKKDVEPWAIQLKENVTTIASGLKEDVENLINDLLENYQEYLYSYYNRVLEMGEELSDFLQNVKSELPGTIKEILEQLSSITRELYLPTDVSALIKPWTYTAMIFGEGHVMTFDQFVYEHHRYQAEGCTYLLAKDFVDGNFTLLVSEYTTTLHVKDSFSVQVGPGEEFFINGDGTPASPPYESPKKDLLVVRDGPWLNITTIYGINVFCHFDQFMCAYELSGWYYHKTRGLLGNLDTEHHNEMIKPDGTVTENLNEWLNSYEVTGRRECEIPQDYVRPSANCASSQKSIIRAECDALFNDTDSPLQPIYETVCPRSFHQECIAVGAENCGDVSELVDNYWTLGALMGVFADLPGCADPSWPCVYERPIITTADIIFVVSENWRMLTGVTDADLKQNLNNLYVSIRTNYPESNFALVAYGGNEYGHCAPHLHSNEMEFFSAANYERAINSLEFCADQDTCTCSPTKGDALKAIKYASELRLRDSAGKIFVLIDNFEKDYTESERLAAADVLAGNSITFNVISEYIMLEKTIGKVSLIGVNHDGQVLYNKRNSAETVTETLDLPKGPFAKLATATDGAMIGYNYLTDADQTTDVQKVLKKMYRVQLDAQKKKTVQCQSVRDIYGRPSTRCGQI